MRLNCHLLFMISRAIEPTTSQKRKLSHIATAHIATKSRCQWVGEKKPLMVTYHDEEWGIAVHDDLKHFELLTLEGAQAGLSWETILNKREGYRKAFKSFDPAQVAVMSDTELAALLVNPDIVRHKAKINSTRTNARVFLDIQQEHGSFDKYIWAFVGGKPIVNRKDTLSEIPSSSEESMKISLDLKNRGMKFVGPTIMYAYMQAAGLVDDHTKNCWRAQCN